MSYFSPYSDQNFFGFFSVLFTRLYAFLTGKLSFSALAADEVQIVILSSIAIAASLVGTFLVLRRMAMLANALSHTILLGIVVAYLLCQNLTVPILMVAALLTGVVTTFLTEFLNRVIKLQEDASIGLIFSIFFALGILLLSLFSRNVHIGTELVMGNVDALHKGDILQAFAILGINAALFLLLYYGFKITTFDPQLARIFGFSPLLFNYLLMVQTSVTAVGAFRAVGVLMVLAFLVLPPLTARQITYKLSRLVTTAACIGVFASVIGVALSRHILTVYGVGLSTGGIIVTLLGIFYFLAALVNQLSIDFSRASHYDPNSTALEKT